MDRISQICSYLDQCSTFADVGCDHGYCTRYMLKNNLCERAVIADISAKSLNKAETLLADYIKEGRCRSVCCDGLKGVGEVEQVLIAGMGGEEIIKILRDSYIPKKFVFQPMKNAELVRSFLIERGCAITVDDIFKDGKFYFIIKGTATGETEDYTKSQLAFGYHSISNPVLKEYLKDELTKVKRYLNGTMSDINRQNIMVRYQFMLGVYKDEIK